MKFSQNYSWKRNFIIYHFLVKGKPHERIALFITTAVNIYQTRNPIVMKTCFSGGKLMKQFGNPPLSKRTPLSTNPHKNPTPLILGQKELIEAGISDFHQMIVIVMKTHKSKKTKTIQYRNYKHFHEQSFNFELNNQLLKIDINSAELKEFNEFVFKVLDKHTLRKQKFIKTLKPILSKISLLSSHS